MKFNIISKWIYINVIGRYLSNRGGSVETERFSGKKVIITGGGQGIGQAIAYRFAREGAHVMIIGRTKQPLGETVNEIKKRNGNALYYQADLAQSSQVQACVDEAIKQWGRIDVLINNAAADDNDPFLEITEENLDRVINTNLKAPFIMSQMVAREMIRTGGGVILHTSSIDAVCGERAFSSYTATKAGLLGLNRTMAIELARYNIRVNCVSPGYTHTEMAEQAAGPENTDYMLHSFERVPLRRMVRTDEVASAFAYLASDEASAITGVNLVIDCGTTANMFILETLEHGKK
jgi:NAD(P)-dependent dehydrogenase (short-subunit alcohol dehydrogenase family)